MTASGPKPSDPTVPATPAAGSDHNAEWDAEDAEWRHRPVAPRDEKNPLRSIGESIGDVVTGSGPNAEPTPPSDRARPDADKSR